jgi:ubiquinone/menaquinone biosynthesis C-methylase UbiE
VNSGKASAEQFKREDAGSYDSFADEFDQFDEIRNPVLQTLFSLAALDGSERLLDVGTGTGIVALEAARRLGPNATIAGVDLSEGLLRSAHRKAMNAGLSDKICFLKMDAEALAIKESSFDAVLSLFALLHFPDPKQALAEMFRVLRPGGVAVIAVGSAPPWLSLRGLGHRIARSPELLQLARGRLLLAPAFLDHLLSQMYPSRSGDEETELARHSQTRMRPVLSLMRTVGFIASISHWDGYEHTFDDPERFWLLQRVYSSISRKRLSTLSDADREAVKSAFLERCHRVLARGGRLVYPYAALFVCGRKPLER